MSAKMEMEVINVIEHGITGHCEVHVRIISTDDGGNEAQGPLEVYGIDALALQRTHKGDLQEWLRWVASRACENHEKRMAMRYGLAEIKGKRIPVEKPS